MLYAETYKWPIIKLPASVRYNYDIGTRWWLLITQFLPILWSSPPQRFKTDAGQWSKQIHPQLNKRDSSRNWHLKWGRSSIFLREGLVGQTFLDFFYAVFHHSRPIVSLNNQLMSERISSLVSYTHFSLSFLHHRFGFVGEQATEHGTTERALVQPTIHYFIERSSSSYPISLSLIIRQLAIVLLSHYIKISAIQNHSGCVTRSGCGIGISVMGQTNKLLVLGLSTISAVRQTCDRWSATHWPLTSTRYLIPHS